MTSSTRCDAPPARRARRSSAASAQTAAQLSAAVSRLRSNGDRPAVMRTIGGVVFRVRSFTVADIDELVALALRAWEPVFESMRSVLGSELFVALRGEDWREGQAADVKTTISDEGARTWVAEIDRRPRGFATAALRNGDIGEVVMVAVAPSHQRHGLASALTETAMTWLRERGAAVVMVETGGDPGHAAARATYESLGFTASPVMRYFKQL
jgi:GNAT superfamily N-acetyltransferase